MWQVLIKTSDHMVGHYVFSLATPEDRAEFVKRPDVWWYQFAEDDGLFGDGEPSWDSPGGVHWRKGGAWEAAAEEQVDYAEESAHAAESVPADEDDRW
jgi:hypothetical protein